MVLGTSLVSLRHDGRDNKDGRPRPSPGISPIVSVAAFACAERKAAVGFEPTNNGFANRRLRPLGYAANSLLTILYVIFCAIKNTLVL